MEKNPPLFVFYREFLFLTSLCLVFFICFKDDIISILFIECKCSENKYNTDCRIKNESKFYTSTWEDDEGADGGKDGTDKSEEYVLEFSFLPL